MKHNYTTRCGDMTAMADSKQKSDDSLELRIAKVSLTMSENESTHNEHSQYRAMAAIRNPHKLGQRRDTMARNRLPTQSINKKHKRKPH